MISVGWSVRRQPLGVVGAVAFHDASRALARRVAQLELRGVVTADALVVFDSEPPWVDGVVYLGHAIGFPGLLMDTRLEPSVPPGLLVAGWLDRGPIVWVPDHDPIAVGRATRLDPAQLLGWSQR